MRRIARDDVTKAVGQADDVTIAKMIATGATVDELAEAQAWLANYEPLLNAGRPLATGRVRELVHILSGFEPGGVRERVYSFRKLSPSEEDEAAGPAVTTQE